MNSDEVIKQHMLEFVKETEREMLNAKVIGDNKLKSDVVNSILKEIEKEIPYEN